MTDATAGHGLCWKQMATGSRRDRELSGVSAGREDVKMDA